MEPAVAVTTTRTQPELQACASAGYPATAEKNCEIGEDEEGPYKLHRTALLVAQGLYSVCPCSRVFEKSNQYAEPAKSVAALASGQQSTEEGRSRSSSEEIEIDGIVALKPSESFEALFKIREKIGEGHFGKVFACCGSAQGLREKRFPLSTVEDEEALCVKVVPTGGKPARATSRTDGSEEANLIKLFREMVHPNVVRYHHFLQTTDTLYIVMERCCGLDLLDHLSTRGGRLTVEDAYSIAVQVLEALAAVHSMSLMHRDVKPENFRFLDRDCQVLKLLDFGFAKPFKAAGSASQHTVTGTMLYAAPEVFDGLYCEKCDLWSAGVIFYLLLSGQMPFETSDLSILRSMFKDPVLTGSSLIRGEAWTKVPSAVIRLVRRLLTVDPAERPDAKKAHRELLEFMTPGIKRTISFGDSLSGSLTPLVRSHNNLLELKRTYYVWNLEDQAGSDSDCESRQDLSP